MLELQARGEFILNNVFYNTFLIALELFVDPVSNVSIHGNNWLKHGDIMNMNISCNGSAPFYYCWAFDGFMNETSNINIHFLSISPSLNYISKLLANASCELPIKTNNCELQLLHYFSSPGQYILPVVLYNQVFYQVIPLKVNIYEGARLKNIHAYFSFIFYTNTYVFEPLADRKAQLSLVVVPIASTCVAIVSIAFGVGLYFYTRRKYDSFALPTEIVCF